MEEPIKPFEWFNLDRLQHDPAYPDELASRFHYPNDNPFPLGKILSSCIQILLDTRDCKNYKNKRIKHINEQVLIGLPSLSNKIKKLCRDYPVDWCIYHPDFTDNIPSLFQKNGQEVLLNQYIPQEADFLNEYIQSTIDNERKIAENFQEISGFTLKPEDRPLYTDKDKLPFIKFRFEIDLLDLLALNVINLIDETFLHADACAKKEPESIVQARRCWILMKARILLLARLNALIPNWLEAYKEWGKHNKKMAGRTTAKKVLHRIVVDDVLIANILLSLLNNKSNRKTTWNSLHQLADNFVDPINEKLKLASRVLVDVEKNVVSNVRLKAVIKEMNRYDKTLLAPFVKKPIPDIRPENSRWVLLILFVDEVDKGIKALGIKQYIP